jgi:hypothetical protein
MKSGILYEGPSLYDGSPIVVIATTGSKNSKTGSMVQTWILRADVEPHTACKTGEDSSVCGTCPHRPELYREAGAAPCYVTVFQAPLSVFRAYKRGRYPRVSPAEMGAGRVVRVGSYGDPAAVPVSVWTEFVKDATAHTGYTHGWNRRDVDPALRSVCMASADTVEEATRAQSQGWRTFRVAPLGVGAERGEIVCPASKEAGQKTTCAACKLCRGADDTRKRTIPSITIQAH